MIDAHCHLDSERLDAPVKDLVSEARAVGVTDIVMAGVDPDGWRAQRALAERFEGVHPVFGIHPQLVPALDTSDVGAMLAALERALESELPVALGETGVDRLTPATKAAAPLQEVYFREQLRLARRFELPVVLHLLRADEVALRVLKEEGLPAAGGVVHSFSGSADFARQLVRLGLHLSFAGTLTFPQSRRLREAAAATPPERLLVETDAPDQTPAPHRGTTNRPAHVRYVVEALAEVRELTFEETAELTADNARRVFGLSSRASRRRSTPG